MKGVKNLSNPLKAENEKVLLIVKSILGDEFNASLNTPQSEAMVSNVQQDQMEQLGDQLVEQERLLIEKLQCTVIEFSARITAIRKLQETAYRESGKQAGMRMARESINERG